MATPDNTLAYFSVGDGGLFAGTSLATINPTTKAVVKLGSFRDEKDLTTPLEKVYGLACGKDGELYATQQRDQLDTQIWKVILPAEKNGTSDIIKLKKIGSGVGKYNGNYIDIHAMDIGPDGQMYMLDLSGNIFTIDLTTGEANLSTAVATNPTIGGAMDIVFDNEGTLFAVSNKKLYKVNAMTGAVEDIGFTRVKTATGALRKDVMGIWSDADGNPFGTDWTEAKYYSIDKKRW